MLNKKVEIVGISTSELPILTNKEAKELLIRINEGDENAKEIFIKSNLRLVLRLMQKYIYKAEASNVDDIFQVGCIGLVKAVNNFDVNLGLQFSTYAVPMILGEIKRYIRDDTQVRVSRSVKEKLVLVMKTREQLETKLEREPTNSEIAKELDFTVEEVVYILDSVHEPFSFSMVVYGDGGDQILLQDKISDTKSCEETWINNLSLKNGIDKLETLEKDIISMRFKKGKTQIEVANELLISQAQVSRIEKKALKNVKKFLE